MNYPQWDARKNLIQKPDGDLTCGDALLNEAHRKPCPRCGVEMLRRKNLPDDLRTITPMDVQPETDHILSKSEFPQLTYHHANLEVICKKCNNSKGTKRHYDLHQNLEKIQNKKKEFLEKHTL